MGSKTTKREAGLDVIKFILSLMVVAIHSSLWPMVLYPWLRLAVPIFFAISSYLFFRNIQGATPQQRSAKLKRFVLRNLKLYLFWFVVLMFYLKRFFADGILIGFLRVIQATLFADTFPASWFLQALIVGTLAVFWASSKMKNSTLLTVTGIFYAVTVLRSSYWNVFEAIPWVERLSHYYELCFMEPMYNASAAMFWIALGKSFAEGTIRIKKAVSIVGTLLSCALLYAEWRFVRNLNGTYNNDCYFFLMPAVLFIFPLILSVQIRERRATLFMGKASVLIYTAHMPVKEVYNKLLNGTAIPLMYITVVALCIIGSVLVFKLERRRGFGWLKYSH